MNIALLLRAYVFLLLMLTLGASAVQAQATYYVRAGAAGSGNGLDWTNAYSSIPSTLQRGATYYIADGNYSSYTCDDLESSTNVITIKKATQQAHGTDTGWQVAYGDGQAVLGSIYILTDNWVIDGSVGGGPGSWTSGHGIRINGRVGINPSFNSVHSWTSGHGSNVTLRHLEIVGSSNYASIDDAVSADFTTGLLMSHLYTRETDNCPLQTLNAKNVTWEYCYVGRFYASADPNPHGEIMSADGGGNYTIRWNIFRWVASTGGLIFDNRGTPTLGMKVYGNVFYRASSETWGYGPSEGVIGNWTGKPDNKFHNISVYNNTFINVPQIALGTLDTMSVSNVYARNNYFYNTGTGLPNGRWGHDYNHYQDSGTESESNGTQGSGNPFVSLDTNSIDFARLTNNTQGGDPNTPEEFRRDWFNVLGTNRGAIQSGASAPAPAPPDGDPSNLRKI